MGKAVKKITGGLFSGSDKGNGTVVQEAPAADAVVSTATADEKQTTEKPTEKAVKAKGKKSLTVSKGAGTGVNI